MTAYSLPMDPDSEVVWLLGLAGFVTLATLAGVGWLAVSSDTAVVAMTHTEPGHAAVNVTVESVGGPETVVATTTYEGGDEAIYRTTEPGTYRVILDSGAESCRHRVTVEEHWDGLGVTSDVVRAGPAGCPAQLRTRIDTSPPFAG